MNSDPIIRKTPGLRTLAWYLGAAVSLLAACGWLGWPLQIVLFKSISPSWDSMKPNTALGLWICGFLLTLMVSHRRKPYVTLLESLGAIFLLVLGTLTLLQYLTGADFGIDTLIFHDEVLRTSAPHPGRMSPSAAFCFVLAGLAFWTGRPGRTRDWLPVLQCLASALMVVGAFPLLGYLANALFEYKDWTRTGMAIHTATAFFAIGAGIFLKLAAEGRAAWFLDRRTTWGFAAGVLLMVMAVNTAQHFAVKMQRLADLVGHRQGVLRVIQQLGVELSDIESSRQGFIITGDETLLTKRPESIAKAMRNFMILEKEIVDNPVQLKNLAELGVLIQEKNRWDELAVAERKLKGFPHSSRLEAIGKGMDIWQRIRLQFGKMRNEEYRLLALDQNEVEATSTLTYLLLPLGAFLSLTLIFGGLFFMNSAMGGRVRSEQLILLRERQLTLITANLPGLVAQVDRDLRYLFANQTYEDWFGRPVREILGRKMEEIVGTAAFQRAEGHAREALAGKEKVFENKITTVKGEVLTLWVSFLPDMDLKGEVRGLFIVAMDISRLKKAEEEVRKLNISLEQRVADRTAELESTNKELEAFSYSVSHDLRAPLRTVDGFSQAVMEDYGSVLPEEGKRYLQLVRNGAQRMGTLIDDLLTFSRLSRLPIQQQNVNMARLVSESLAELDFENLRQSRTIEMKVATLPLCEGDPVLLKQVWINLISNALKYSRKCESARIEIGCRAGEEENTYFIRDNGTGFDMRYTDKLFGVFQRLHRAEDYEGTGVGLAIVQRVIHRHGGRIWADSKPGEGATFYFTLKGETK